jgi:hypothetical protein
MYVPTRIAAAMFVQGSRLCWGRRTIVDVTTCTDKEAQGCEGSQELSSIKGNDQVIQIPVFKTAQDHMSTATAANVLPILVLSRACHEATIRFVHMNSQLIIEFQVVCHEKEYHPTELHTEAYLPSGKYLLIMKGIFFSRSSFTAICTTLKYPAALAVENDMHQVDCVLGDIQHT